MNVSLYSWAQIRLLQEDEAITREAEAEANTKSAAALAPACDEVEGVEVDALVEDVEVPATEPVVHAAPVPAPVRFAAPPRNMDAAQLESGGDPDEILFCIKWNGRSHLHNTWHTEAELKSMDITGLKKLQNFMKIWEQQQRLAVTQTSEEKEYVGLQRAMLAQVRAQQRLVDRVINMNDDGGETMYLCKWQGLPYRDCTWELASHITAFQDEIDRYLTRVASRARPNSSVGWKTRPSFRRIVTQPSWLGNGTAATTLRAYQLEGLNWLAGSWCRSNSVILADEMGLGKTVQTISFLSYLFHVCKVFGPFLIVVPLSTVMAWQREFRLWASDMNLVVYLGDRRSREIIRDVEMNDARGRPKFNVLLTTYEIVLGDNVELSRIRWSVLAVDEAHRLKNDSSQLHVTLRDLQTAHRLLITGTPLQVFYLSVTPTCTMLFLAEQEFYQCY
jgi:hypothetical protein